MTALISLSRNCLVFCKVDLRKNVKISKPILKSCLPTGHGFCACSNNKGDNSNLILCLKQENTSRKSCGRSQIRNVKFFSKNYQNSKFLLCFRYIFDVSVLTFATVTHYFTLLIIIAVSFFNCSHRFKFIWLHYTCSIFLFYKWDNCFMKFSVLRLRK